MKPPTNTTAPPAETLGQPAQRSYEKGDPMAIVIPTPVADQCPSTTVDRATDESTRCILPAGHDGRHDDGCLTWTWGDVRPIFGTVTAAGPVRFIHGPPPDPIRAALVETLRFSDPDKPLFRYGDRVITGPEMVALLDARDPIAEDFVADVVFAAVQAVKSIFPPVPPSQSLTLILTPAHLRAMAAAGWRAGEENPATWLVERLSDVERLTTKLSKVEDELYEALAELDVAELRVNELESFEDDNEPMS